MTSVSSVIVLLVLIYTAVICEENVLDEDDIPGLEYLNKSADPCDDFYQFTCGNFKSLHPRPERDLSVSDSFEILRTDLTSLISDILETEISEDEPEAVKKAKAAYHACIHSYFSDDLGLEIPELRIIEDVGGMPLLESWDEGSSMKFSWNDAGNLVAKYGIPVLFKIDIANPFGLENSIYLSNDNGLQLPDFIIEEREKGYDLILDETLHQYANKFFVTASSAPEPFDVFLEAIVTRLRNVINPFMSDEILFDKLEYVKTFMRQLYRAGDSEGAPADDLPAPRITLGGLNNWTRTYFGDDIELDWVEFMKSNFKLAAVNITEDIVVIHNIGKQIYGTLNLVRKTNPDVIKNFMLLRLFLYLAPDSDRYMRNAFEDYYKAKNYPLYPRWQYCARKLSDATGYASLSFAVAHQYQKYYFDINKLSKAVTMIKDLEYAFKDSVSSADWMDQETKDAASEKAENMLTLLAFPDFVEDGELLTRFYENMRICHWDHYGNSQAIRAFQQAYTFSQIGKNKNRTFWNRSPFEVNAYYNRPNNRMTFPVSMLNLLFFTGNISVLDYGRIGSIIGHEITHGFDSEGRKYNQDGILAPWWSPSTLESFTNKTECFVQQYGKYLIDELNKQIDGSATLNENLADNGGLRNAYRAYEKLKARGEILHETSKFTSDQLFFIGFGTMWCTDASPNYLRNVPNYSPARFRVNGAVSNSKDFSKAFNCPSGSKMNPAKKCVLW